jgi:hypothetical protein
MVGGMARHRVYPSRDECAEAGRAAGRIEPPPGEVFCHPLRIRSVVRGRDGAGGAMRVARRSPQPGAKCEARMPR